MTSVKFVHLNLKILIFFDLYIHRFSWTVTMEVHYCSDYETYFQ